MNEKVKQKENAELELNRKAFDKVVKICLTAGIILSLILIIGLIILIVLVTIKFNLIVYMKTGRATCGLEHGMALINWF